MRPDLASPPVSAAAAAKIAGYHADLVSTIRNAVSTKPVVVVGMGWNPHVKRARKALDEASIPYDYHEIGNYASEWKPRLAVKIWSGWPTFPQVFVAGTLIGGATEVEQAIADGSVQAAISAKP